MFYAFREGATSGSECKRSQKGEKRAGARVEGLRVQRPLPGITTTHVAWAAFVVAAVLFVLAVALIIGMLLSTLSLLWGMVVALTLTVLVAGLLLPELRDFWARLPR